jgi:hypothetical protein
VVHVADVNTILGVIVILHNNFIEEGGELCVAGVGASVTADTRIDVLATRENAGLK